MITRKLVSNDEAIALAKQHTIPCADCPFARAALKGWLGSMSVDEWIAAAHGESLIDCHTTTNMQCAGAAIYRANVAKSCYTYGILKLKPNMKLVFATPMEFREHHSRSNPGKQTR